MIEFLILSFFLLAGLFLYFLPTINAARRSNPSAGWIFFFNLIFGMTLIGWFFALWWSETDRSSIANFVGRSVMYLIAAGLLLIVAVVLFVPDTSTETKMPAAIQKHRKSTPIPAPQQEEPASPPEAQSTKI